LEENKISYNKSYNKPRPFIRSKRPVEVDPNVNEGIQAERVLLVDDEGKTHLLSKSDALALAEEKGLDLVLIAPNANPVVCKLLDYAKYVYDKQKKEKEIKKNQKIILIKEIQLSPVIQKHDIETRLKQATKFLLAGNKVKVRVYLPGRLIQKIDMATTVINNFVDSLSDLSKVETPIKLEGKNLQTIIVPTKK